MAGIYVHIPFCKSRCIYCDFFSTTSLEERDRYVVAVKRELEIRKDYLPQTTRIDTVYFGGGTPSMLRAEQLCDILNHIRKIYDVSPLAEITAEGNPDDLSTEYLSTLRQGGFNRLSMGVQTFSNERLRFLCRRHTVEVAEQAVSNARKAGFENISIDLMYGFPGETLEEWEKDIEKALCLNPEHISAYALMYEEGTRLWTMLERGTVEEIDENLSLSMYETLMERLRIAGYEHYEISNFCNPDHHSRHNSSYWEGVPYIGIGAAAHSFDGQSRQWNPESLNEYFRGIESGAPTFEREILTKNQCYDEMVMTGLRTAKGVDLRKLENMFGKDALDYCMSNAQPHIEAGRMMIERNSMLKLSKAGIFTSDDIMSDLMMATE